MNAELRASPALDLPSSSSPPSFQSLLSPRPLCASHPEIFTLSLIPHMLREGVAVRRLFCQENWAIPQLKVLSPCWGR